MTSPALNTVWRENDRRFDRYVKVVGHRETDGKVQIKSCTKDGGVADGTRVTHAAASAFGRRYKAV